MSRKEIPIFCGYQELRSVEELIPNPKNPNTHTNDQILILADLIEAHGWRTVVTVSDLSGYIVRGHGRYEAAKLLNCQVPVEVQHYESEDAELADLIADNQVAELSEQDREKLAELFKEMETDDLAEHATGFTTEEIAAIMEAANDVAESLDLDEEEDTADDGREKQIIYTCPKCGFEFTM